MVITINMEGYKLSWIQPNEVFTEKLSHCLTFKIAISYKAPVCINGKAFEVFLETTKITEV